MSKSHLLCALRASCALHAGISSLTTHACLVFYIWTDCEHFISPCSRKSIVLDCTWLYRKQFWPVTTLSWPPSLHSGITNILQPRRLRDEHKMGLCNFKKSLFNHSWTLLIYSEDGLIMKQVTAGTDEGFMIVFKCQCLPHHLQENNQAMGFQTDDPNTMSALCDV